MITEAQVDAAWAVLHDTLGCKREHVRAALEAAAALSALPAAQVKGEYAMSPGDADHFKGEALAAREALGFDPASQDISPSDMTDAIHALKAALTETRTFLICCRAEAKGVNENRYAYANELLSKVDAALSAPAMPDPTPREGEPVAWASTNLAFMLDLGGDARVFAAKGENWPVPLYTASPSAALIAERGEARHMKEQWRKLCLQHEQTILNERTDRQFAEAENAALKAALERDVPPDVARLVVAARIVAFEDQSEEAIKELDSASEAFSERVPWDDTPLEDMGA